MLLFLDFDGVLHPFFPLPGNTDAENQMFSSVPSFEKAILDLPVQVDIVISSSWRNRESLAQLRAHFSPAIADRIVGFTPNEGSGNGPGARQVEVEKWLVENNRQGEAWIGVDDYPELYSPGAAVVVCHDKFGERESALLKEAVGNPHAFAQRYPVPADRTGEKKIVVVNWSQQSQD